MLKKTSLATYGIKIVTSRAQKHIPTYSATVLARGNTTGVFFIFENDEGFRVQTDGVLLISWDVAFGVVHFDGTGGWEKMWF